MYIGEFVIKTILFGITIVTCFYLPGKLILEKLNIKTASFQYVFLSIIIGMMAFTLLLYAVSFLGSWIMSVPIIVIVDYFALKKKSTLIPIFQKQDVIPFLFILLSTFVFSLTMITNGQFGNSIRIIAPDAEWHIQIINELKAQFPPENPGFSGVPLKGYHIFYDFIVAKISNIFNIPTIPLYFQFFPILVSFLWATGVYSLVFRWSKDKITALWAVFLTMFGGSFAWILVLRGHKDIVLNSIFGIDQPVTALFNPSFAISVVIIIGILIVLYEYFSARKKRWLVLLILLSGPITLFKVYAGMIVLPALFLLSLYELFKRRHAFFLSFIVIGIIFLATYWVFTDRSARLYFQPFWPPHRMIESNMPWYGYTEKIYTYSKLGVIRGLVETELYAFYVFFIGNLGTRFVGIAITLWILLFRRKRPTPFGISVFVMTCISIAFPMLFIQSTKVYDIIEMAWYFIFFCALFAALGFGFIFRLRFPNILKVFLALFIVVLTLPSAYEVIEKQVRQIKQGFMPNSYKEAVQFLRSQGTYSFVVLELPPVEIEPTENDIEYWYYKLKPGITVYSEKRGFLQYQNFTLPGANVEKRLGTIRKFVKYTKLSKDDKNKKEEISVELRKNNIKYIYMTYLSPRIEGLKGVKKIFKNEVAIIYSVNL